MSKLYNIDKALSISVLLFQMLRKYLFQLCVNCIADGGRAYHRDDPSIWLWKKLK